MFRDPDEDPEIWRYIPDFEEYAASSLGRIAHTRFYRVLKPLRGTDGRQKVHLFVEGTRHQKYVHQLVAGAFAIGHEWGEEVGHLNGDYTDNRVVNLDMKHFIFGWHTEPEWFFWEEGSYGFD